MIQKLINQMTDAVELANYLHKQATESEDTKEKRDNLRYLGQCLKSMQEHINDSRERIKDSTQCRC